MVPLRGVSCVEVNGPDAEAYRTDQPFMAMGAVVGLNSSMKSFCQGALVLPPPPYTWLITNDTGRAGLTGLIAPGLLAVGGDSLASVLLAFRPMRRANVDTVSAIHR